MNVIRSARLDILCAKAFIRKGWVFLVIIAFTLYLREITFVALACFWPLYFFSQYPFMAYEKAPEMMGSLPQRRVDVVRGRYALFALGLVFSTAFSLAAALAFRLLRVDITGTSVILCVCVLVSAAVLAAQGPLYFRFGYARGRYAANFPVLLVIVLLGAAFALRNSKGFAQAAGALFALRYRFGGGFLLLVGALGAVLLLVVSYYLSLLFFTGQKAPDEKNGREKERVF